MKTLEMGSDNGCCALRNPERKTFQFVDALGWSECVRTVIISNTESKNNTVTVDG